MWRPGPICVYSPSRFRRLLSTCSRCLKDDSVRQSFVHTSLTDDTQVKSRKRNRILVLKPDETRDKRIDRMVKNMQAVSVKKVQSEPLIISIIPQDFPVENDKNVFDAIEAYKPPQTKVSEAQFKKTIKSLETSFTKEQLVLFAESLSVARKIKKRSTKGFIARTIVELGWGIKFVKKGTIADVLLTEYMPVSKRDLFLMLVQNGQILQHVRKAVTGLDFSTQKMHLAIRGTASQINTAKLILAADLENVHTEKIDLTNVKRHFEGKIGVFPIKQIGKNSAVYFNHVEDEVYELSARKAGHIQQMKRLLVSLLDFNLHTSDFLLPSEKSYSALPYCNDESLPWAHRTRDLFVLKNAREEPGRGLKTALAQFDSNVLLKNPKTEISYGDEIETKLTESEIEALFEDARETKTESVIETESLPEEVKPSEVETGSSAEKENEISEFETSAAKTFEPENEASSSPPAAETVVSPSSSSLSEEDRKTLYEEITTFSSTLPGVGLQNQTKPHFTITLGNLLFDQPDVSSRHIFNSDVPLAVSKLRQLPLAETDDKKNLETPENADFNKYWAQFKFMPLVFDSDEDLIKYPPVEMWTPLNDWLEPKIDEIQLWTLDSENKGHVLLPDGRCDIEATCHVYGDLLKEKSTSDLDDIDSMLSSKFSHLQGQPGVSKFFDNSEISFSGKHPLSIEPLVEFVINGRKVKYQYVNVNYIRRVEFKQGERIIDFSLMEGGLLGGRKVEIKFIGGPGETSEAEFNKLMDDTLEFINSIEL